MLAILNYRVEYWRNRCISAEAALAALEEEIAALKIKNMSNESDDAVNRNMQFPDSEQDLYYLQDSRYCDGNSILWWKKDYRGYTTNLDEAHLFTKNQAHRQQQARGTDIPWKKDFVDARSERTVDMQCLNRVEYYKLIELSKETKDE